MHLHVTPEFSMLSFHVAKCFLITEKILRLASSLTSSPELRLIAEIVNAVTLWRGKVDKRKKRKNWLFWGFKSICLHSRMCSTFVKKPWPMNSHRWGSWFSRMDQQGVLYRICPALPGSLTVSRWSVLPDEAEISENHIWFEPLSREVDKVICSERLRRKPLKIHLDMLHKLESEFFSQFGNSGLALIV